jgi:two-component system, chemotaxis family, CheB/CheR fusion protein
MKALPQDGGFEALLEALRRRRGFDFTGYKRPSLMRRFARRMHAVGAADYASYAAYLEQHDEELGLLFNTILINVTSFFRDPAAWDYLRRAIVPVILSSSGAEGVRVWSAGCATGEEAYTLAMLFAEALGEGALVQRVKIYATDADEEALAQARAGSFAAKDMAGLAPGLAERYFEHSAGRSVFRKELRRAVIFGRHDLVRDPPISRVDLLACRNTIMYFNAESQRRVLDKFYFALKDAGYLFLGRAEMLLTHADRFVPVELKCRVFEKVPPAGPPRRRAPAVEAANAGGYNVPMASERLHDRSAEELPLARIVVDANGIVTLVNQLARVLFTIGAGDIGRPLKDLEISYRPVELRSLIEQAYSGKCVVTQPKAERRFPNGEVHCLEVAVAPFFDDRDNPLGVSITFLDVTQIAKTQSELAQAREELQTATEELQSSNEELETTNEELQSSNEELETTNEELQSTNEELETMNEELQSTNEEMQALNEELRQRTDELHRSNAFMQAVLRGLGAGAAVVDANFEVLIWNEQATELWGLRGDEALGRSFLNLDIGLPVGELRGAVRACLTGEAEHKEVTVDAVNRRGKPMRCRVSCRALVGRSGKREGAIVLMEDAGPGPT